MIGCRFTSMLTNKFKTRFYVELGCKKLEAITYIQGRLNTKNLRVSKFQDKRIFEFIKKKKQNN